MSALPIGCVMLSCCSCVVYLEYMSREIPGSMTLLTFSEFLFIALEGFVFYTKCGTRLKFAVPLREYFLMVAIFFVVNIVNNAALSFHIPLPLHVIFRSGSLVANMLLGMWLLHRRYTFQKYLSVALITAGIIICTLMSQKDQVNPSKSVKELQTEESFLGLSHFAEFLIGICMLTFALFFSALLGIFQEKLYAKHGKHPREALFLTHALPLPFFLIFYKDIYAHLLIFNQSAVYLVPLVGVEMPVYWYYLLMSVITQYACIRFVYVLTSEFSSLTVTLVVTLRKFLSLVISIIYFQNPFTLTHWIGTALVFGGTLLFADTFKQVATTVSGFFLPRSKETDDFTKPKKD